jgi:PAS domain S-box-containing protein
MSPQDPQSPQLVSASDRQPVDMPPPPIGPAPSLRARPVPAPGVLRASRLMLALGALVYPAWWWMITTAVPNARDSLAQRLAMSATWLLVLATSRLPWVEARLVALTRLLSVVLTAHFLWLVALNPGVLLYQLGLVVVLAAVGAGLSGTRALLGYTALALVGSVSIAFAWHDPLAGGLLLATVFTTQAVVLTAAWRRETQEAMLMAELAASRDFLGTLVDHLPDPLFVRDDAGLYQQVNAAMCQLVNLTREQMLGRGPRELYPPSQVATIESHRQRLGPEPYEYEIEWHDQLGRTHSLLTKLTQMPLRDGRLGHVGVIRDISTRKAMERSVAEAESLFRNAFEHAPIGMILVSRRAVLLRVNRAFCDMLGYTEAELVGMPLAQLTHPDDLAFCTAETLKMMEGQVDAIGFEKRYVHKSGRTVWVLASASGVTAGAGQELYVAQLVDITVRKQAAEALVRAKEAAEAATRAKSAFLATVSHEIRTPMNGVLAALDLVLQEDIAPESREFLLLAHASALGLLSILHDVLDVSKIEAGRLELEPAPMFLRAECAAVLQHAAAIARGKGLQLRTEIDVDVPDALEGDALRLRQVLTNLVGNAVKFTDRGHVTLRVMRLPAPTEPEVGTVPARVPLRFEVIDTGIGIAPHLQTAVFQPFVQGDAGDDRRHGGTGLGLAIASQLVELMGGTLSLRSEPGQGSCFSFEIALAPAAVQPAVPSPPAMGLGQPLHVLLVDDNAINLLLTSRLLERLGHRVETASSGAEALDRLTQARFDVVLMDVQMPGMDGLAATREIRIRPQWQDLPVIGLTALSMLEDRERCLQAGMSGYLTKPVETAALEREIRRVTEGRTLAAEPEQAQELAAELLERVGGDQDLLDQLCTLFSQEQPGLARLVESAVQSRNGTELARAAHQYKGMLLNLGADHAAQLAAHLERMARADDLDGAETMAHDLATAVATFLPHLAAVAARPRPQPRPGAGHDA